MFLDEPRSGGGVREGYPDHLGSTRKKTTETLGAGCHHVGTKSRHDFWKSGASPTHIATQESRGFGCAEEPRSMDQHLPLYSNAI